MKTSNAVTRERLKGWRREIRRLASLWAVVRKYAADWGEDHPLVVQRREQAEQQDKRLRLYIDESRVRGKDEWYARLEAARLAPRILPRATLHEELCARTQIPTWRGPGGEEPERKVVGVRWCKKLRRWEIRLRTRTHEYRNTLTQGYTIAQLAEEVDLMKAYLAFSCGLIEGRVQSNMWNEPKVAACFTEHNVGLDESNPLHAHLIEWVGRLGRVRHDGTLRDVPTDAWVQQNSANKMGYK